MDEDDEEEILLEMTEEEERIYNLIMEKRRTRLSWADIARGLEWPIHKLTYFRKKFNIVNNIRYIDDGELWELILEYQTQALTWGEPFLLGAFNSVHYDNGDMLFVPRSQLRRVLHANDVQGTETRMKNAVYRVRYTNPGYNYAYHIDGWHKLIMYKIVVHGCIDGFSRKVIFLKASTNNKATTVFQSFFRKVQETGEIPALISVDGGGENVLVADFMIYHLGVNALKIVSSHHNQRIERLWRDASEKSLIDYRNLFMDLQNEGILDIDDIQHIWLIHFLFLDLINKSLERFIAAWNNHGIRTEDFNLSPLQIEHFARENGDIFVVPEDVDVLDTGTLLDDYDIFDENNEIPLVQVEDIEHPFTTDNDLNQFIEEVIYITSNDMSPGNIGIVKNKWVNAFVLMQQIINNED